MSAWRRGSGAPSSSWPARLGLIGTGALAMALTAWAATALFPSSLYTWGGAAKRCAAIGSGGTIWAACSTDGDCGSGAPTGACVATIAPDDFDQVAEEVEAIESFLGVNGVNIAIGSDEPYCMYVTNLSSTGHDGMIQTITRVASTLEAVSCQCKGTCTTPANIQWYDEDANAIGSPIVCNDGTDAASWTDVSGDADAALGQGDRAEWSVDNTPNPDATDEYAICATFSKQ